MMRGNGSFGLFSGRAVEWELRAADSRAGDFFLQIGPLGKMFNISASVQLIKTVFLILDWKNKEARFLYHNPEKYRYDRQIVFCQCSYRKSYLSQKYFTLNGALNFGRFHVKFRFAFVYLEPAFIPLQIWNTIIKFLE